MVRLFMFVAKDTINKLRNNEDEQYFIITQPLLVKIKVYLVTKTH